MSNLQERLIAVQSEIRAPKNQFNDFGKYKYRSTEDILEAIKPVLKKYGLGLLISDELKSSSSGIEYIEAKATIFSVENDKSFLPDGGVSVTAQAGIDVNKKGMDLSQTFGAASSYARKYALNGLFLIDDSRDADATNTHGKKEEPRKVPATNEQVQAMIRAIHEGKGASVAKAVEKYSNINMEKLNRMAELTK